MPLEIKTFRKINKVLIHNNFYIFLTFVCVCARALICLSTFDLVRAIGCESGGMTNFIILFSLLMYPYLQQFSMMINFFETQCTPVKNSLELKFISLFHIYFIHICNNVLWCSLIMKSFPNMFGVAAPTLTTYGIDAKPPYMQQNELANVKKESILKNIMFFHRWEDFS